jgi:hypothetical protein
MAATLDQISATTRMKYIPKMVDVIFDSDPILKRSEKFKVKVSGGTEIRQPLAYAQPTSGGWYTGADTLDVTDTNEFAAASYEWKQLYQNVVITGYDRMVNSGDEAVLNFVKEKVKNAGRKIRDLLCDGIYNDGTTTNGIVGLQDIVATAQTVGGLSQSTYSWWRGQVDSSTTTLTMAALQSSFNSATINNESPTVALATRANYNRYYALLQPQQRFVDSASAKGGFTSLMFNGIPLISGSKVPSGYVFFLNEEYLHLYTHTERDFKFEDFEKIYNQDVEVARILWMGAFGSSNNRMHAALTAITA